DCTISSWYWGPLGFVNVEQRGGKVLTGPRRVKAENRRRVPLPWLPSRSTCPRSPWFALVPKLCLGTLSAKLCFAPTPAAKQSFANARSQTEFGNEKPPCQKRRSPPGSVDTRPRGRYDPSNPSSRPLSQAVRQRIANPPSPVRIREGPLCPRQSLLLVSQK